MHKHIGDYIQSNWQHAVKLACRDEGRLIGVPFPNRTPGISGMFQEL